MTAYEAARALLLITRFVRVPAGSARMLGTCTASRPLEVLRAGGAAGDSSGQCNSEPDRVELLTAHPWASSPRCFLRTLVSGQTCDGQVGGGRKPESVVLRTVETGEFDLLIMGVLYRSVNQRLYFGPKVDRILRESNCSVAVVVSPAKTQSGESS